MSMLKLKTVKIIGSAQASLFSKRERFNERFYLVSDWSLLKEDSRYKRLLRIFEQEQDIYFPKRSPISLFRIGEGYFVWRDGNRRVSIAKTKGIEFILAKIHSNCENCRDVFLLHNLESKHCESCKLGISNSI